MQLVAGAVAALVAFAVVMTTLMALAVMVTGDIRLVLERSGQ